MSTHFELVAESRTDLGRSASRCLRRCEKLPGIIYGAKKEPVSITLRHDDVFHALENEAFYSSILDIKIDGHAAQKAVIKDLQRHAYKPKLVHIDFLRVDENTEITMNVPLHFVGVCPAVEEGGVVNHLMNEVEIRCLPKDLPEYLEVDISNLQLDESIHLSQLKIPTGVAIVALEHDNDEAIANVHVPRAVVEEEPVVAAPAEGEAAAAPAEGAAPAAPAADAKKEEKK